MVYHIVISGDRKLKKKIGLGDLQWSNFNTIFFNLKSGTKFERVETRISRWSHNLLYFIQKEKLATKWDLNLS